MSRFFYNMGRLLQFLKPGSSPNHPHSPWGHSHSLPGNAVTSAEIERMRQKNKDLVKKLRDLDAQLEKQEEANHLRERCRVSGISFSRCE
jgi:hypothetical protein